LLKRPDKAEIESIRLIDNKGNFTPPFVSTLKDIFNKFDTVRNNLIDWKEFRGLLEIIGKSIKDEIEFRVQILGKHNSMDSGLTFAGFMDWWK